MDELMDGVMTDKGHMLVYVGDGAGSLGLRWVCGCEYGTFGDWLADGNWCSGDVIGVATCPVCLERLVEWHRWWVEHYEYEHERVPQVGDTLALVYKRLRELGAMG